MEAARDETAFHFEQRWVPWGQIAVFFEQLHSREATSRYLLPLFENSLSESPAGNKAIVPAEKINTSIPNDSSPEDFEKPVQQSSYSCFIR